MCVLFTKVTKGYPSYFIVMFRLFRSYSKVMFR